MAMVGALARRLAGAWGAALLLLVLGGAAIAQETTGAASAAPDPAVAAEVDRLMTALDDPAVREALRQALLKDAEAGTQPAAEDPIRVAQERLASLIRAWDMLDDELDRVVDQSFSDGKVGVFTYALVLALVGGGLAFLVSRALRRVRERCRPDPAASFGSRLIAALGLVLIDLAPLLAFLAGVHFLALAWNEGVLRPHETASVVSRASLWVFAVAIAVDVLWSPPRPEAGLLRATQPRARLAFWVLVGSTAAIVVIAAIAQLLAIAGMAPLAAALFSLILSISLLAALLILVWRVRGPLHESAKEVLPPNSTLGRLMALWPVPVSLYLLVVWAATLGSVLAGQSQPAGRLILSLVLPLIIFAIAAAYSRGIVRSIPQMPAPPAASEHGKPDPEFVRQAKHIPSAMTKLAVAAWLVAIVAVIGLLTWLYEFDVASSLSVAPHVFSAAVQVICVALVAYIVYALLSASIARAMVRIDTTQNPSRAKRLRTLLPLFRVFLLNVVVLMAVLISLSAMGIDIGPLIAGAGILGLAIGFGSQKLVADIVAGVFFLLDDAFAVGDFVEVGGLAGQVESLSIRSMKLRHARGPVHTIPFGEINSLTNHSRDWVIVKLEFRLPSDTDLAVVKKIVKRIGAELEKDPEVGKNLLETLKSQGVRRFEDNAMIVGVKFKSLPGEQFVIRRMVYQKIRDAFAQANIHFADRGVVVRVGANATPAETAAAAAAAVQQQEKAGH
ncbi:MAG TPA: mechanosensitive ion channel family protein [Kiloniellales bacterium]|nr:mechanosensitive ion channel family protein [Kiloniellales bacterium]